METFVLRHLHHLRRRQPVGILLLYTSNTLAISPSNETEAVFIARAMNPDP